VVTYKNKSGFRRINQEPNHVVKYVRKRQIPPAAMKLRSLDSHYEGKTKYD
jgi:hypothetical protein